MVKEISFRAVAATTVDPLIRDSKSRNWDSSRLTVEYWCDYTGRRAAGSQRLIAIKI